MRKKVTVELIYDTEDDIPPATLMWLVKNGIENGYDVKEFGMPAIIHECKLKSVDAKFVEVIDEKGDPDAETE